MPITPFSQSQAGGFDNVADNQANTSIVKGESKGVGAAAQSGTNAAQRQDQNTTASAATNQTATAAGQVQGNNQNQAADSATQQAVDQGNAILNAAQTAATLESQRNAGFSAALGSAAKS